MANFKIGLKVQASNENNDIFQLTENIDYFTNFTGNYKESWKKHCFSYDESLSRHQHDKKELTFKMDKLFGSDLLLNPYALILSIGQGVVLYLEDERSDFIITGTSYDIKKNNVSITYNCQDSFSYLLSKQNQGYEIINDPTSIDFIGAKDIHYWAKKIVKECNIIFDYDEEKTKSFLSEKDIEDSKLYPQLNTSIVFSCSGSNAYNALIELCSKYDFMLRIDYQNKKFWFVPCKNENFNGLYYSPKLNLKSFSVSQESNTLSTIININPIQNNDEIITLIPSPGTYFLDYFKTIINNDNENNNLSTDLWEDTFIYEDEENSNNFSFVNFITESKDDDDNIKYKTGVTEEDIEFAIIADKYPWLSNQIINFKYFFDNKIITKPIYDKINSEFKNNLRIVNGQIMSFQNLYNTNLNIKNDYINDMKINLDSLNCEINNQVKIDVSTNEPTLNYTEAKKRAGSIFKKYSIEQKELVDTDDNLTEVGNEYFNHLQRFYKNLFQFRQYWNTKSEGDDEKISNGLYYFRNYDNKDDITKNKKAVEIGTKLMEYWNNAYSSSLYCKYFLPESSYWTPSSALKTRYNLNDELKLNRINFNSILDFNLLTFDNDSIQTNIIEFDGFNCNGINYNNIIINNDILIYANSSQKLLSYNENWNGEDDIYKKLTKISFSNDDGDKDKKLKWLLQYDKNYLTNIQFPDFLIDLDKIVTSTGYTEDGNVTIYEIKIDFILPSDENRPFKSIIIEKSTHKNDQTGYQVFYVNRENIDENGNFEKRNVYNYNFYASSTSTEPDFEDGWVNQGWKEITLFNNDLGTNESKTNEAEWLLLNNEKNYNQNNKSYIIEFKEKPSYSNQNFATSMNNIEIQINGNFISNAKDFNKIKINKIIIGDKNNYQLSYNINDLDYIVYNDNNENNKWLNNLYKTIENLEVENTTLEKINWLMKNDLNYIKESNICEYSINCNFLCMNYVYNKYLIKKSIKTIDENNYNMEYLLYYVKQDEEKELVYSDTWENNSYKHVTAIDNNNISFFKLNSETTDKAYVPKTFYNKQVIKVNYNNETNEIDAVELTYDFIPNISRTNKEITPIFNYTKYDNYILGDVLFNFDEVLNNNNEININCNFKCDDKEYTSINIIKYEKLGSFYYKIIYHLNDESYEVYDTNNEVYWIDSKYKNIFIIQNDNILLQQWFNENDTHTNKYDEWMVDLDTTNKNWYQKDVKQMFYYQLVKLEQQSDIILQTDILGTDMYFSPVISDDGKYIIYEKIINKNEDKILAEIPVNGGGFLWKQLTDWENSIHIDTVNNKEQEIVDATTVIGGISQQLFSIIHKYCVNFDSELQYYLNKRQEILNNIYKTYGNYILETDYTPSDVTTSEEVSVVSELYSKDILYPENNYSVAIINALNLIGYKDLMIYPGDEIKIKASDFYDDIDKLSELINKSLFISDISQTLRKDDDIQLTVNVIKYEDRLLKGIASLFKKE